MIKKCILGLCFIQFVLGIAVCSFAQDPREFYEAAKKALENGNADETLGYLHKCQNALGGSNAKIESVKCQALVLKSDWVNAGISYNNYDRLTPSGFKSGEAHQQMTDLKTLIWSELKKIEEEKSKVLEEEIKRDLGVFETEVAKKTTAIKKNGEVFNAGKEKQLFQAAMRDRELMLLNIYKEEIGQKGKNWDRISLELQKKANPGNYIVETVQKSDVSETTYLLKIGADPNKKNEKGESLMHIVMATKNGDILEELIKYKPSVGILNQRGETPIFAAIKSGFYSGITILLKNGADAKVVNNMGQSTLFYCLEYNQASFLKLMVKNGVDPNALIEYQKEKMPPLYYAVYHSESAPMVSALLSLGVDVDQVGNGNWTPLMAAVFKSNSDITKLLVNQNAEINKKGPHAWTALHFAVKQNNLDIIRLLLEKGADKNATDEWHRKPRNIAKENKFGEALAIL